MNRPPILVFEIQYASDFSVSESCRNKMSQIDTLLQSGYRVIGVTKTLQSHAFLYHLARDDSAPQPHPSISKTVIVRGYEGSTSPTGASGFPEVYHEDPDCGHLRSARANN
jgi:hypothetical protein